MTRLAEALKKVKLKMGTPFFQDFGWKTWPIKNSDCDITFKAEKEPNGHGLLLSAIGYGDLKNGYGNGKILITNCHINEFVLISDDYK